MARPLRNRAPSIYRLITIRTEGACFYMRPSKDVNKILGGILARYAEILGVKILAYCFMSNHYHLLIMCPRGNVDEFEENINREIARRLNWKLHRQGNFWSRRYSDQEVMTQDDLLEAFVYVSTNATRHGMVEDPSQWPGLSSYNQSMTEKALTFPFYYYSAVEEEKRVTYHRLSITPLPQFESLSRKDRTYEVARLLEDRARSIVKDRLEHGQGFLGVEKIRAQNPFEAPTNVSKSPRPPCYTKDVSVRREFRRQEAKRQSDFMVASMRYRLGELAVEFPEFTFKPPLHRKPRSKPFQELPEDYFQSLF